MSTPPHRTQKSGSVSSTGSSSSSESAPLDNFTGVSNALADISEQEHGLPGANGDVKAQRRSSMEDTEEAIRKYKANLLNYTRKSFDEFKSDIEQRSRSNSTPTSPNFSSSKP